MEVIKRGKLIIEFERSEDKEKEESFLGVTLVVQNDEGSELVDAREIVDIMVTALGDQAVNSGMLMGEYLEEAVIAYQSCLD